MLSISKSPFVLSRHLENNPRGRDFAVGDIHGCFPLLRDALDSVGFDAMHDRLFSVGDLIDRGPASDEVLDWLSWPWFHAVRGNHEQMAVDVWRGCYATADYRHNGGGWFLDLPAPRRDAIAAKLDTLPIAIDVATDAGKVGLVHADIGTPTWQQFCERLSAPTSERKRAKLVNIALWSRSRIHHNDTHRIPDLLALVVGHTPVEEIMTLGNVVYIDTGAVFADGRLTLIDLATLRDSIGL